MTSYSFLKKKMKILKSVKLKQQDVSSEMLVNAIDLMEPSHFKGLFLKN